METKHLKYFKVENFKCFDSFEMDDIGQFNLIVGDNNVGKTSVLEALLFHESPEQLLGYWSFVYSVRNNFKVDAADKVHFENRLNSFFNFKKESKEIKLDFQFANSHSLQFNISLMIKSELSDKDIDLLKRTLFQEDGNLFIKVACSHSPDIIYGGNIPFVWIAPYVTSQSFYGTDLASLLSNASFEREDAISILVKDLSTFITDIKHVENNTSIIKGEPVIALRLNGIQKLVPLSSQGDGAIKLLRILLEIVHNNFRHLVIDEIDTGIHYSHLKQYWKTILQSAKNNQVQLFATTHSLECLKYFKEALEELGEDYQKEARLHHVLKTKTGLIKDIVFPYHHFKGNVELENEMR